MSDFKEIINFLKVYRRTDEVASKNKFQQAFWVDENYKPHVLPQEQDLLWVEKKDLENQHGYFYLGNEIEETLYLQTETNGRVVYYVKRDFQINGQLLTKYKRIPFYLSDDWEEKEGEPFKVIETPGTYYYCQNTEKIIEVSLDPVFMFPDFLVYHPEDLSIDFEEEFTFNYKDHEGYTVDPADFSIRLVLDPFVLFINSFLNRSVMVEKSEIPGKMNLYPSIEIEFNKYVLYYKYVESIPTYLPTQLGTYALRLEFTYIGAMLEFLNQTIFYQVDTVSFSESSGLKKAFLDSYKILVNGVLNQAMNRSIKNVLEILYYTPKVFLKGLDKNILWYVLEKAITDRSLTNIGLNEEDIVLVLLEVLSEIEKTETIFLLKLIEEKNQKKSCFSLLYDKMNGENFVKVVQFLCDIWLKSAFVNFENPIFEKSNGPVSIPYKSEKFAGFYSSNKNFDFKKDIYIEVSEDDSWIDNIVSVLNPDLGEYVNQIVEDQNEYTYHVFQPLMLTDIKQQSPIPLPRLLPAFFLKANEDKAFWSNVITSVEYTVDAITTLSGIGNLAKFRHLAKVAEVASRYQKFDKARKYATAISRIRFGVSAIEIGSGSLNAMLKLTGTADTKFGKALTEYLFWLELLSLGGELTATIKGGLRKSAQEVLEHTDELKKTAKNADEAKQTDEVIEHLEDITNLDLMAKPVEIGKFGGKKLTASQIRKYKGWLKQNGVETFFEEDLILNKFGKITNKSSVNKFKPFTNEGIQFDTLQDFYSYMKQEGGLGVFHAKTKQLFLTKEPTELLAFHEKMHVQHYLEVGEKYHSLPSWEKETYVFLEIWKQKHLYTKEELVFSLKYVNGYRLEAVQKILNYKV